MSREQAFNGLSQGSLEEAGAGTVAKAGAGAWASGKTWRIYHKSSLEYLRTSVVAVKDFGTKSLASCLRNSDLGGKEESEGATERRF